MSEIERNGLGCYSKMAGSWKGGLLEAYVNLYILI